MGQDSIAGRSANIDTRVAVRTPLRRRFLFAGVGLGVLALVLGAAQLSRRDGAGPARSSVETALSEMAARLDARAPLQMSESTVMTGARADGLRLVAEFRISQDIPSADVDAARRGSASPTPGNCAATPVRGA
jgi:hypothetical protein